MNDVIGVTHITADEFSALQQQLAAAREALQAAEADAARYRFLRQESNDKDGTDWLHAYTEESLDAAIDAAIRG